MDNNTKFSFSSFLTLKNNPNSLVDTDHDGLLDVEELKWGTNPFVADTDGDGMNDGDEIKAGRNPLGPGMLKDFFIPHAGNDFKPKSLQPQRLVFHAVTAIAIKIIVVGLALSFPIEAWLMPEAFITQSKKIIEATNQVRQSLGLRQLKENSLLDEAAFQKAQDMLVNQYFAHVSPENKSLSNWLSNVKYNYSVAGENLAMGFSDTKEAIDAWKQSPTHYANMIDPDFNEVGVGMSGGTYNQTETTFIAQMFGTPNGEGAPAKISSGYVKTAIASPRSVPKLAAQPVIIKTAPVVSSSSTTLPELKKQEIIVNNLKEKLETSNIIKSTTTSSESTLAPAVVAPIIKPEDNPLITNPAPAVDQLKTNIVVSQPIGSDKKIIKVEAELSPEVVKAQVSVDNNSLNLNQDTRDKTKWFGSLIVASHEDAQPSVQSPAIIRTWDVAGSTMVSDIQSADITPIKPSVLKQYSFLKDHQSSAIKSIFSISSIYYLALLILAIFALSLNVLVQIKKQHPKIIASALGLIGLLVVLILI